MVPAARSDVYVTLLGIALGAIVIGCVLLALVMNRYEFKIKPTGLLDVPSVVSTRLA